MKLVTYGISALVLGIGIASSAIASAKDKAEGQPRPELFTKLVECRAIAESTARLQCYDATAAHMENAVTQNELYIVDKKQVRETRRSLFGLRLPSLGLFDGGGGGDKNQVAEVELVIRSAQSTIEGWQMVMEDGSVWRQADDKALGLVPSRGNKVIIKSGSLGSFRASIAGQPGIRVKRIS